MLKLSISADTWLVKAAYTIVLVQVGLWQEHVLWNAKYEKTANLDWIWISFVQIITLCFGSFYWCFLTFLLFMINLAYQFHQLCIFKCSCPHTYLLEKTYTIYKNVCACALPVAEIPPWSGYAKLVSLNLLRLSYYFHTKILSKQF